jgi:hypothetical protein
MRSKLDRIKFLTDNDFCFDKTFLHFLSNKDLIKAQRLIIELDVKYGFKRKESVKK